MSEISNFWLAAEREGRRRDRNLQQRRRRHFLDFEESQKVLDTTVLVSSPIRFGIGLVTEFWYKYRFCSLLQFPTSSGIGPDSRDVYKAMVWSLLSIPIDEVQVVGRFDAFIEPVGESSE
ncbi:hypothetical protein ACFX1T_015575 [Malus domestica]